MKKKIYSFLAVAMLLCCAGQVKSQDTWFVSWDLGNDGGDPYDGRSWEYAFASIGRALNAANDGDVIFVQGGTYTLYGSLPYKGVTIYGGCEGGEIDPDERVHNKWDFGDNVTVLNGSELNNEGQTGQHFFADPDCTGDPIYLTIDGLTFVGGDNILYGMEVVPGLIVRNCFVGGNPLSSAVYEEHCMFTTNGVNTEVVGEIQFIDSKFSNEYAESDCSLLYTGNVYMDVTFIGCEITNNVGNNLMLCHANSVNFHRCYFADNNTTNETLWIRYGELNINNTIVTQNSGEGFLFINGNSTTSLNVINCTFVKNAFTYGAFANYEDIYTVPANFYNTIFYGNQGQNGDVSDERLNISNFKNNIISSTEPRAVSSSGNITSGIDPENLFTRYNDNNFYPRSRDAISVNAGTDLIRMSGDYDGNPRIAGPSIDIGAHEYQYLDIPAGETRLQSDYVKGEIVFHSNDVDGTGQLILSSNLTPTGSVELVKTFATEQWYPIGFPFAVAKVNAPELTSNNLEPYDTSDDDGDFWLKEYRDENPYSFYYTTSFSPNVGYAIQFPTAFEDEEVVFTANSPTLRNITEQTLTITLSSILSAKGYYLIANPSTSDLLLESAGKYYIGQKNGANLHYQLMTDGTATVHPFESFGIAHGFGLGEPLRSSLGASDATPINLLDFDNKTEAPRYFNLQGIEVASPVKGNVYIEKRGSEVRKIVNK